MAQKVNLSAINIDSLMPGFVALQQSLSDSENSKRLVNGLVISNSDSSKKKILKKEEMTVNNLSIHISNYS